MKRFTYLLSITVLAFGIAAIGFIGCEGPAGPAGTAGTDGTDGTDGMDANETCKVCHNETSDLLAKQFQAGNSGHMTGLNFERSSASCAACHTHEGFLDRMASGEMAASDAISDATPPNCRTCHLVHETYTQADYTVRYTDPVTLWMNDVEVDFGNGNMCANCHQPRVISPYPESGGADVSLTNKRWGPHHGPQAATLWSTGAYPIAGTKSYPAAGSGKHAEIGCIACHMVEMPEHGPFAGGHTFNLTYEYHGSGADAIEACVTCHSSAEDFDIGGVKTNVEMLHDSLGAMLLAEGWIDGSGYVKASSSTPLVLSPDDAGVVLNWRWILEDKSQGIHQPAYVQALLQNSIEHMNK